MGTLTCHKKNEIFLNEGSSEKKAGGRLSPFLLFLVLTYVSANTAFHIPLAGQFLPWNEYYYHYFHLWETESQTTRTRTNMSPFTVGARIWT